MLGLLLATIGTFNIVATGDSNTTGYAPIRLTLAMQAQGIIGTGYSIASGGATSNLYVGNQLDTNHHPNPAFHNQALEAINGPVYGFGPPWTYGSVIENNPEPDVVVVMLGTNDAIQTAWIDYQTNMAEVFQYLSERTEFYIATPLPLLAYPSADAFINDTMIPWLRTQGPIIDVRADIQKQPNWQSWYNDGVHLYNGPDGYTWLASEILNGILDHHLGDANLDGVVDQNDWSGNVLTAGNWSQGDFNHDGYIDGLDYTLWADHVSPIFIVPEPSISYVLFILLLLRKKDYALHSRQT